MTKTILLAIIIISIGLIGICVKIIFTKNGEFSGTCASKNPYLNQSGEKCSYCGADPLLECKKDRKLPEK
tara:strand:- start:713 stop:922 length:210 start_codon:yes stop_codon:yes gene_type:complete